MSEASCGGYFEVVPTSLYMRSFEFLYRGTAHIFLDISPIDITLTRFVASRQDDEKTLILASEDLNIKVFNNAELSIEGPMLKEYCIRPERQDSLLAKDYSGTTPFAHIMGVVLYASAVPDCGLAAHSCRTQNIIIGDGGPAAILTDEDLVVPIDNAQGYERSNQNLRVTLIFKDECPIQRLARRLREAYSCTMCSKS